MNHLKIAVALACGLAALATGSRLLAADQKATVADADAFIERYNEESKEIYFESAAAAWIQSTYITSDSQLLNARAGERALNFQNRMIEESKRFNDLKLSGDTARGILLLKVGSTMPAPRDGAKVKELATLASSLEATYGTGKYCPGGGEECFTEQDLIKRMATSTDYADLLDAWRGWRTVSPPMRSEYQRFVELMNEGARELGFADTGELWKAGYDMAPDAFEADAERLWLQVKPLYEELHCFVRDRLSEHYGNDKVPAGEPIPAHLLGNMWAQEWGNIYDLVKPFDSELNLDITAALEKQGYDAEKMVRSAEEFYTSMGLRELPESFWQKSMLVRPQDREVVCHASAWPMNLKEDVRIKMCITPTEEDLTTIYHELGHIYYFLYYNHLPPMFQSGANDGFHEGIGDALTLSMTPAYFEKIGLLGEFETDEEALINYQMKIALDKIAFLPFGKLIDQWRWDVFSGKIQPDDYNAGWWRLRTEYQGIAPPVARSEADFDPGAKYHIPGNTPYTRYFLARILQFQFYRSMCDAAGFDGPLHECSFYGSKAAGDKLAAMLSLGQSKPWPEALYELTGTREMDASAIIEYFAPLMSWLQESNKDRSCGW
jgi:peptidyl-dipeptidase A